MTTINIGIIGLDTSHSVAFAKLINATTPSSTQDTLFRVTHAYPQGSHSIESSVSRIPAYTQEMIDMGIGITDSLNHLIDAVDVVLLETNDGRLHLPQAQAVITSGKPLFIDKPIAASLEDAIKIFDLAETYGVPVFSASSLRFAPSTQALVDGSIGDIIGADIYSPAKIEKTHPDLFWYGIHGIEALFTIMGTGCISVQRFFSPDTDVVVGQWSDGRYGIFRGLRKGKTDYGGVAFGSLGIAPAGRYEGYQHLVKEILQFFTSGIAPVSREETLEIFAFMEAAEHSKMKNGQSIELSSY